LGVAQDYQSNIAVNVVTVNTNGTNTGGYEIITAASLLTGQILWNITTYTGHPGLDTFFSTSDAVADHGEFACRMLDGPIKCWDLHTGKLLWTSDLTGWPWGDFGAYSVQSAYGLYYTEDYSGVHAVNWTNGQIAWNFQAASAPFETPYNGGYSWHSTAYVVDGVYYTFTCEHTPSEPITRGWRLYALNATTGTNIWNVSEGSNIPSSRAFQGAISDGYLAITNEYDGYMYVYGKGQSSTTVSAPQTAITLGQSVELTGKVLDQSPGSTGTPAYQTMTCGNGWPTCINNSQCLLMQQVYPYP
jgi:outer membrane protein assembly factor BamB